VKQLFAILFSVLLVQMQIVPVAAAACPKSVTLACTSNCGQMGCCTSKPTNSQPAPAVPQSNTQNQVSLLVPAVTVWNLPENPANSASSVFSSRLVTISTPLYARNCSLLL
jgi:hypothetical protein